MRWVLLARLNLTIASRMFQSRYMQAKVSTVLLTTLAASTRVMTISCMVFLLMPSS